MSLSKSCRDRRWLEPEPRITVYAIEDLGLQMLARLIRDPDTLLSAAEWP